MEQIGVERNCEGSTGLERLTSAERGQWHKQAKEAKKLYADKRYQQGLKKPMGPERTKKD